MENETFEAKKAPKYPKKKRSARLIAAICVAACLLLTLVGGLVLYPILTDPYGSRILEGVSVGGVDLGGMTKSEAAKALEAAFGTAYSDTDMVLTLPDKTFIFSPADSGAKLNAKAAAKAAFRYGREEGAQSTLSLTDFLGLKTEAIRTALTEYTDSFPSVYRPSGFHLEGEMPELAAETYREDAPCQKLILDPGTAGVAFTADALYEQILDGYESQQFCLTVSGTIEMAPAPLDVETIAQEVSIAPVEPQVNKSDFSIIPGAWGYGFDAESAQALIDAAKDGEMISVPMHYIPWKLQGDEVYFQDLLGYCKTPHGNNENRNSNLRKACGILDGLVLQPGEEFSYNETLGERTKANGWLPAPAYSGVKLVDSPGGGICQVSSTLYLCSLYSELTVLERTNHGFPVSYIPIGLDATVNWGFTDLKLRNDYPFPVKLLAEESDGYVRIRIMGTETRDYYVKMEYHSGGRYATTYRCRYDRNTDELIYREADRRSAYLDDVQSVYGWIGSDDLDIGLDVHTP